MSFFYINTRKRLRIGPDEDRTSEWLQIKLQVRIKAWWGYWWKTVYYASCSVNRFFHHPNTVAEKIDEWYQNRKRIPALLIRQRKTRMKKFAGRTTIPVQKVKP